MAKATFERVFTIKGAEVYIAREAPEEVEEAVPEEAALPPEVHAEATATTKKVDSGMDRIEAILRELLSETKKDKPVDPSIKNLSREILKLTQDTVHLKESVNAIPDSLRGLLSGVTAAIKELSDNVLKTGKGTPETSGELKKLRESLDGLDKSVQGIGRDIPGAAVREVRNVIDSHSKHMRDLFKELSETMKEKQKEVGKVAEAAVESVHDTKNATEVLAALLKEFDKGYPNLTDMLLRLCSYFEQVRAQNLPWQEKLAMERAGVELKKIMDFVVNIEDKTAADSDRITESYAKLSDDFERLRSEVRGSYKEQLEAAYQRLSELKSSFENLVGSFEVNISSIKDTLVYVHKLLSKKTEASTISDLVGDIIKKLKLALTLVLRLHSNVMPPLLKLIADSEDFFSASGRLIVNIEESLVKATEIVFTPVVSPAREFEPPPSKEYVSLKARVEANLDKLKYMTKMHYFMLDVEAMTETKKAFSTILRFYEMFSRAVEGGSRRIHSINRCRAYEKKLIPYIEHFNKMLIRFSGAPRQRGGSDYDDYRYYLTKMETTTKNINYHYVSLQT